MLQHIRGVEIIDFFSTEFDAQHELVLVVIKVFANLVGSLLWRSIRLLLRIAGKGGKFWEIPALFPRSCVVLMD